MGNVFSVPDDEEDSSETSTLVELPLVSTSVTESLNTLKTGIDATRTSERCLVSTNQVSTDQKQSRQHDAPCCSYQGSNQVPISVNTTRSGLKSVERQMNEVSLEDDAAKEEDLEILIDTALQLLREQNEEARDLLRSVEDYYALIRPLGSSFAESKPVRRDENTNFRSGTRIFKLNDKVWTFYNELKLSSSPNGRGQVHSNWERGVFHARNQWEDGRRRVDQAAGFGYWGRNEISSRRPSRRNRRRRHDRDNFDGNRRSSNKRGFAKERGKPTPDGGNVELRSSEQKMELDSVAETPKNTQECGSDADVVVVLRDQAAIRDEIENAAESVKAMDSEQQTVVSSTVEDGLELCQSAASSTVAESTVSDQMEPNADDCKVAAESCKVAEGEDKQHVADEPREQSGEKKEADLIIDRFAVSQRLADEHEELRRKLAELRHSNKKKKSGKNRETIKIKKYGFT